MEPDNKGLLPKDIQDVLDRLRVVGNEVTNQDPKKNTCDLSLRFETTDDPEEQRLRQSTFQRLFDEYGFPLKGNFTRLCDSCECEMPYEQTENVIVCSDCNLKFDLCDNCMQNKFTLHCPEGFGCKKEGVESGKGVISVEPREPQESGVGQENYDSEDYEFAEEARRHFSGYRHIEDWVDQDWSNNVSVNGWSD